MPYAIPSAGGAARDGQDTEEASTECFRSRPLARLVGGHEARSEAPAKASLAPVADLSIGDHLQDFVCFCCLVSQCPVVCRLYVPGILRILRAPQVVSRGHPPQAIHHMERTCRASCVVNGEILPRALLLPYQALYSPK